MSLLQVLLSKDNVLSRTNQNLDLQILWEEGEEAEGEEDHEEEEEYGEEEVGEQTASHGILRTTRLWTPLATASIKIEKSLQHPRHLGAE